MSTTEQHAVLPTTDDEFVDWCRAGGPEQIGGRGGRFEWNDGTLEITMSTEDLIDDRIVDAIKSLFRTHGHDPVRGGLRTPFGAKTPDLIVDPDVDAHHANTCSVVVEVVSATMSGRARDLGPENKPRAYAASEGVREYWTIDPDRDAGTAVITVRHCRTDDGLGWTQPIGEAFSPLLGGAVSVRRVPGRRQWVADLAAG